MEDWAHIELFGYSRYSSRYPLCNRKLGNFLSSSLWSSTCFAILLSWALRRTASMSPTAKPICRIILRLHVDSLGCDNLVYYFFFCPQNLVENIRSSPLDYYVFDPYNSALETKTLPRHCNSSKNTRF